MTSKKQQDQDGISADYATAYQEYWSEHFSDQKLPQTELAIVGTRSNGDLPIHDRWWLTRGAGIRLGTSFNGLGISKTAEISTLSDMEVNERKLETEQYLQRLKREHLGDKLSFIFVSL